MCGVWEESDIISMNWNLSPMGVLYQQKITICVSRKVVSWKKIGLVIRVSTGKNVRKNSSISLIITLSSSGMSSALMNSAKNSSSWSFHLMSSRNNDSAMEKEGCACLTPCKVY